MIVAGKRFASRFGIEVHAEAPSVLAFTGQLLIDRGVWLPEQLCPQMLKNRCAFNTSCASPRPAAQQQARHEVPACRTANRRRSARGSRGARKQVAVVPDDSPPRCDQGDRRGPSVVASASTHL